MNTVIRDFAQGMEEDYKRYAYEIEAKAHQIDEGGDYADYCNEIIDDIIGDIKSRLGADMANNTTDAEAAAAIVEAEAWVTDSVSNGTTVQRLTALYTELGAEKARQELGTGKEKVYRVRVEELQQHSRIYTITANSEAEALAKAERGDTDEESSERMIGVISRDNATIISTGS